MFKIYDQGVLAGMILKSQDINDKLPKEKYAIYPSHNTLPLYSYTRFSNSLLDRSILLVDNVSAATNVLLNYCEENRIIQSLSFGKEGYKKYCLQNVQIRKNGKLIGYDVEIYLEDYNSGSMLFENTVLQRQVTYEIYHFADKIMNVIINFVGNDKSYATFLRDYSIIAKQGNSNE